MMDRDFQSENLLTSLTRNLFDSSHLTKKNHENTIDNPTIKKGRFVPAISIQRDLYNYANYNEIPLDKKFERSFQLTYRDPS